MGHGKGQVGFLACLLVDEMIAVGLFIVGEWLYLDSVAVPGDEVVVVVVVG